MLWRLKKLFDNFFSIVMKLDSLAFMNQFFIFHVLSSHKPSFLSKSMSLKAQLTLNLNHNKTYLSHKHKHPLQKNTNTTTTPTQDAQEKAKDEVRRRLQSAERERNNWQKCWEEHQRKLQEGLVLCRFYFDLKQVSSFHSFFFSLSFLLFLSFIPSFSFIYSFFFLFHSFFFSLSFLLFLSFIPHFQPHNSDHHRNFHQYHNHRHQRFHHRHTAPERVGPVAEAVGQQTRQLRDFHLFCTSLPAGLRALAGCEGLYERSLGVVWRLYGDCLKVVLRLYGGCMEVVWRLFDGCMEIV